jgi:hypothetical protein
VSEDDVLAAVREVLRPRVSGYFPNLIREPLVTCRICSTPVDGFPLCYQCNADRGSATTHRVASAAYAIRGQQSGYVMRGYKAPMNPVPGAPGAVAMLLAVGLRFHARCAESLAGQAIAHWATVPSLPAKVGEHPFHALAAGIGAAPGTEVTLLAASSSADPRAVSPEHFKVTSQVVPGSHVLVLDDTWVKGGHAQSAVGALLGAGAGTVSVFTVARWLEPKFGTTGPFIKERLSHPDYDPAICPWTGGPCP